MSRGMMLAVVATQRNFQGVVCESKPSWYPINQLMGRNTPVWLVLQNSLAWSIVKKAALSKNLREISRPSARISVDSPCFVGPVSEQNAEVTRNGWQPEFYAGVFLSLLRHFVLVWKHVWYPEKK